MAGFVATSSATSFLREWPRRFAWLIPLLLLFTTIEARAGELSPTEQAFIEAIKGQSPAAARFLSVRLEKIADKSLSPFKLRKRKVRETVQALRELREFHRKTSAGASEAGKKENRELEALVERFARYLRSGRVTETDKAIAKRATEIAEERAKKATAEIKTGKQFVEFIVERLRKLDPFLVDNLKSYVLDEKTGELKKGSSKGIAHAKESLAVLISVQEKKYKEKPTKRLREKIARNKIVLKLLEYLLSYAKDGKVPPIDPSIFGTPDVASSDGKKKPGDKPRDKAGAKPKDKVKRVVRRTDGKETSTDDYGEDPVMAEDKEDRAGKKKVEKKAKESDKAGKDKSNDVEEEEEEEEYDAFDTGSAEDETELAGNTKIVVQEKNRCVAKTVEVDDALGGILEGFRRLGETREREDTERTDRPVTRRFARLLQKEKEIQERIRKAYAGTVAGGLPTDGTGNRYEHGLVRVIEADLRAFREATERYVRAYAGVQNAARALNDYLAHYRQRREDADKADFRIGIVQIFGGAAKLGLRGFIWLRSLREAAAAVKAGEEIAEGGVKAAAETAERAAVSGARLRRLPSPETLFGADVLADAEKAGVDISEIIQDVYKNRTEELVSLNREIRRKVFELLIARNGLHQEVPRSINFALGKLVVKVRNGLANADKFSGVSAEVEELVKFGREKGFRTTDDFMEWLERAVSPGEGGSGYARIVPKEYLETVRQALLNRGNLDGIRKGLKQSLDEGARIVPRPGTGAGRRATEVLPKAGAPGARTAAGFTAEEVITEHLARLAKEHGVDAQKIVDEIFGELSRKAGNTQDRLKRIEQLSIVATEQVAAAIARKLGWTKLSVPLINALESLSLKVTVALRNGAKAANIQAELAVIRAEAAGLCSIGDFIEHIRLGYAPALDSTGIELIMNPERLTLVAQTLRLGDDMKALRKFLGPIREAAMAARGAAAKGGGASVALGTGKVAAGSSGAGATKPGDKAKAGKPNARPLTEAQKARYALYEAILKSNPDLAKTGGLSTFLDQFEIERLYKDRMSGGGRFLFLNKFSVYNLLGTGLSEYLGQDITGFQVFYRDSLVNFMVSPVTTLTDFWYGFGSNTRWREFMEANDEQIDELRKPLNDAVRALERMRIAFKIFDLDDPNSVLGGRGADDLMEVMLEMLETNRKGSKDWQEKNRARLEERLEHMNQKIRDLTTSVENFRELNRKLGFLYRSINELRYEGKGRSRTGVDLLDPSIFIRLTSVANYLEVMRSGGLLETNGPLVKLVSGEEGLKTGAPVETIPRESDSLKTSAEDRVFILGVKASLEYKACKAKLRVSSSSSTPREGGPKTGTTTGKAPEDGGEGTTESGKTASTGETKSGETKTAESKTGEESGGKARSTTRTEASPPAAGGPSGSTGTSEDRETRKVTKEVALRISSGDTGTAVSEANVKFVVDEGGFDTAEDGEAGDPDVVVASDEGDDGKKDESTAYRANIAGGETGADGVAVIENTDDVFELVLADGTTDEKSSSSGDALESVPAGSEKTTREDLVIEVNLGESGETLPLVYVLDIPPGESGTDPDELDESTIRLVELTLAAKGLNPGEIDGKIDSDLRRAIVDYQIFNQLVVTGLIDDALLRALFVKVFEDDSTDAFVTDIKAAYEVQDISSFKIGKTPVVVAFVPVENVKKAREDAKSDKRVKFTEIDPCSEKDSRNDPHYKGAGLWGQKFDNQWAIKRVGYTDGKASAWASLPRKLTPVTVAVIDSGIDWKHPDFNRASLWRNRDEIPGNGRDDDNNGHIDDVIGWDFLDNDAGPWDLDGHGTFVAGVIAAANDNGRGIAGINPAARIMALRVLDPFGRGYASTAARAVAYAADNGARVINLSLNAPAISRVEQLAIDYARKKGAVVVVAAGNDGKKVKDYSPAGLRGAITVAATNHKDRRAGFSNYGPLVDISAPGIDVLSLRARYTDLLAQIRGVDYKRGKAITGPDRAYYRASGTSFSAPIVAGTASLLMSARPELTGRQVERMILHSAGDIETPGFDNFTGYGLLDAARALKADPDYFVEARLDGVKVVRRKNKKGLALRVLGTIDADKFAGARILIGKGAAPKKWGRLKKTFKAPVRSGPLADIPAGVFKGAKTWTIRLITKHKNGSARETRFRLNLG